MRVVGCGRGAQPYRPVSSPDAQAAPLDWLGRLIRLTLLFRRGPLGLPFVLPSNSGMVVGLDLALLRSDVCQDDSGFSVGYVVDRHLVCQP